MKPTRLALLALLLALPAAAQEATPTEGVSTIAASAIQRWLPPAISTVPSSFELHVNVVSMLGKATITGGTGKFAGISGEHDYDAEFFGSPAEGAYQGIGHKKGHWTMSGS